MFWSSHHPRDVMNFWQLITASSRRGNARINRQQDAHDAGLAGLRRDDLQLAVVRLDDLAADGQAESESHGARGEKWRGHFFGGFGGETRSEERRVGKECR